MPINLSPIRFSYRDLLGSTHMASHISELPTAMLSAYIPGAVYPKTLVVIALGT